MASDSTGQAFIFRAWPEGTTEAPEHWRGHITQVPSQRQQYVGDLGDVIAFLAPYLSEMAPPQKIRCRLLLLISRIGRTRKP